MRSWLEAILGRRAGNDLPELAQAVALNLDTRPLGGAAYPYIGAVVKVGQERLYEVVHATVQLAPDHLLQSGLRTKLRALDALLVHASSAFRVADDWRGLVWRVDPTVDAAYQETVMSATPGCADLLRNAWRYAYQPHPDPTSAYRDAVRAVEQAYIPVVSPISSRATLGTIVRDLGNQAGQWELVLVDTENAPANIAPVVQLLQQLWQGQRSRHGGGANSRDQHQDEAEAAVHLAVLAVQRLTSGALRRKP